jgi:hypothetical protein
MSEQPPTEAATAPQTDAPSADQLRRAEAKPPLYRLFRGTLYVLYMVVTVWLCLAIVVAAWRAVWGEPGRTLRAQTAAPAAGPHR